jgi:branched-chain amino acid transport system substrate-binding protein
VLLSPFSCLSLTRRLHSCFIGKFTFSAAGIMETMRPRSRHTFPRLLLLIIPAVILHLSCGSLRAEEAKIYKVGFIGPFSGPVAYYGDAAQKAIEMAFRELGGSARLKVSYEDDQFQAAKTVAAFQKLVNVEKVDCLMTVGSTPGNALAPLAQAARIPSLVWGIDPKITKGRSFLFRTYPSPHLEASSAAAEAQRLGYQEIGIIITVTDIALAYRQVLLEKLPPASIKLSEEVTPEITDLRPIILRSMSRGVKQLALCSLGQQGLIAKQARELGFTGPIFGCSSLSVPDEHERAGGALKGAWYFAPAREKDFETKFQAKYGKRIDLRTAAAHYDTILILQRAFKEIKNSSELIPHLLQSGSYKGALSSCEFTAEDGDPRLECEVAKYVINE